MSAQQFQPVPIQSRGSRNAVIRSGGAPSKLGGLAPRVIAARTDHDSAIIALQRQQTGNPTLAAADSALLATVIFYWLFVVLAYAVDCWLTAPFIDEQITMYLSTLPHVAKVLFLWLSPAIFVALDITASLQRHDATETGRSAVGWTAVCVVLVLLAGMAVVSLQLTQETWDIALAVKTAFLACFVMTVHAVLVFHQQGPAAIAYPLFAIDRSSLTAKRQRSESDLNRLTREFSDTYRLYLDDLRTADPGAGPVRRPELDVLTERVIAEIFARAPIIGSAAAPDRSGPAPEPSTSVVPRGSAAAPTPPQVPTADGGPGAGRGEGIDAENAYLRSVLDRQVHDADSEVTV